MRNAAYASMKLNRGAMLVADDEAALSTLADTGDDPEVRLMKEEDRIGLVALLAGLPVDLRETLILREFEELSYKEIARITEAPIGTVMSRLWRARRLVAEGIRRGERVA